MFIHDPSWWLYPGDDQFLSNLPVSKHYGLFENYNTGVRLCCPTLDLIIPRNPKCPPRINKLRETSKGF